MKITSKSIMFTCFIVTVIPQSRDHVGRWERPQLPRKSRLVGPSRKQTAPRMTGTRHLRSTDGRQGSGRECIQPGHTVAWWWGGGAGEETCSRHVSPKDPTLRSIPLNRPVRTRGCCSEHQVSCGHKSGIAAHARGKVRQQDRGHSKHF